MFSLKKDIDEGLNKINMSRIFKAANGTQQIGRQQRIPSYQLTVACFRNFDVSEILMNCFS